MSKVLLSKMRILVTGLEGFTGQYVQKALENYGHEVVGLKANLTDLDAVRQDVATRQPEAVIHLAAIAFVGHGDANAFYQLDGISKSSGCFGRICAKCKKYFVGEQCKCVW